MRVHTLNELNFRSPPGKRLAVLGDPVAHSLSPVMHNAALREISGEDLQWKDWCYEPVHVPAGDLELALERLHQAGVVGINLTLPHKIRALELAESVDDTARRMGAVNTLVRTETGYNGTNTDGYGILKGLEEGLQRVVDGSDCWLFGAGGAARGIVVALIDAGAHRVTIVNRSEDRLREMEKALIDQPFDGLDRLRFSGLADAPMDPAPNAIFINATSLGLKADDPSPIPGSYLLPGVCVYDTTYGSENKLSRACAAGGVAYADGLAMLVWQGVRSLEIWTARTIPAECMRTAVERELLQRKNHG